jgi:hypothetical protein
MHMSNRRERFGIANNVTPSCVGSAKSERGFDGQDRVVVHVMAQLQRSRYRLQPGETRNTVDLSNFLHED